MAKLSSILFNRTISQFLDCDDLQSKKGQELTEKIRSSSVHFLDKILETITESSGPHREALTAICRNNFEIGAKDFLLDSLLNDNTQIRSSASDILSRVDNLKAEDLFSRLHQSSASRREIIQTLATHLENLKPDDLINNAVKLPPAEGKELLKLAEKAKIEINLSKLRFQVEKIDDATFKASLVRYFGSISQAAVIELITRFLSDKSKLVVLEALKSLNNLNFRYDVSVLLPFVLDMNDVEQKLTCEVIQKQADASLVYHAADYLLTRSDLVNETLLNIVADHANEENLPNFLAQLQKQDSWNRDKIINNLQALENKKLINVAQTLSAHSDESIRISAQKLSGYQLDMDDIEKIGEFALNENWQVRQRAIQTLGKSSNRDAINILTEVLNQWPDAASSVLTAVKQLGFSKGLPIALKCLTYPEASIQKNALETITSIVSEKHALKVRDNLVGQLKKLNLELTDIAKAVVRDITRRFNLPELDPSSTAVRADNTTGSTRAFSPLPTLQPGSNWMDRYLVRKVIGQGAMGQVILVEDEMMEELLILKFMHPELAIDKASFERFKREVKYARRVGHPNVIRVHDLIQNDSVCAISMEYFNSRGLEHRLGQGEKFDIKSALQILYQVSDGMAAAHEQAVIHRDLKPSNILIDETGHVKIADFGISSASSGAEQTLTQTGAIIGSPAYLAPERIADIEADNRSDIYSLGIIAYYMFSGNLPYVGNSMEVLGLHREGSAPPLNKVDSAIPDAIADLVGGMMKVRPDDRPQTMIEVRDAFKALLNTL